MYNGRVDVMGVPPPKNNFRMIDEKTNGESSHIDRISELNSFKELKDNLISKGLLNEG